MWGLSPADGVLSRKRESKVPRQTDEDIFRDFSMTDSISLNHTLTTAMTSESNVRDTKQSSFIGMTGF